MATCVQTAWQSALMMRSRMGVDMTANMSDRFVKYLILVYCHLVFTFMFVYSNVRIYWISDKFKSGITPKKHLMSKNLGLLGKALQDEPLQFHLNL